MLCLSEAHFKGGVAVLLLVLVGGRVVGGGEFGNRWLWWWWEEVWVFGMVGGGSGGGVMNARLGFPSPRLFNLALLHLPQKRFPLPNLPPDPHAHPLFPLALLAPHIRHEIPPREAPEVARIPHIVAVEAAAAAADGARVDGVRAHARVPFAPELHPPVDEGFFAVPAPRPPREVGGGGLRREEEPGDGPVGAEEGAHGRGPHEWGDSGEVDYTGFLGGEVGGGDGRGSEGFWFCFGAWFGIFVWAGG